MQDSDFQQALQRYAQVRNVVYAAASDDPVLRARIRAPMRFADIDAAALETWRRTWTRVQPFGRGGWDWGEIVRPLRKRPTSFALAIWSGDDLCGLLAGRTSKRRPSGKRHTLSLRYREGQPDRGHPLRGNVASLALGVAELYAGALSLSRVRLVEPLPGVVRIYERLGYHTVQVRGSNVYSEKMIGGR